MATLDHVGKQCEAVVAVDADVTRAQMDALGRRGTRAGRVKLSSKGGNPFGDMRAVQRFPERLKDLG